MLVKRIITSFIAICLFASPAFASPPDPETRIDRMQDRLDLSDEQVNLILDIFAAAKESCNCENTKGTSEGQCKQNKKEEVISQIKEVLTEEQLLKFQKRKGEGFEQGKGAGKEGREACRKYHKQRRGRNNSK